MAETTQETYEYAGFQYHVTHSKEGVHLSPLPGQHPAAGKQKHLKAAADLYLKDRRGAK